MKKNEFEPQSRRKFLQNGRSFLTGLAGMELMRHSEIIWKQSNSLLLPSVAQAAQEANKNSPFLIYIHLHGGWHGWTGGIFQPTVAGVEGFPMGAFQPGKISGSNNPHANRHFASGPFLFNSYSKVLSDVANNLVIVAGNARTVGHDDGALLQSSGSKTAGNSGSPTWPLGIASVRERYFDDLGLVVSHSRDAHTGATAANARLMRASNHKNFAYAHAEYSRARSISPELKNRFSSISEKLSTSFNGMAPLPQNKSDILKNTMKSIDDGLSPEIAADPADKSNPEATVKNPILLQLQQELSFEKLKLALSNSMNSNGEDLGLKGTLIQLESRKDIYVRFLESLQLAGLLAHTGKASGMCLDSGDVLDAHGGGACVTDAQSSAILLASLTLFWKWIGNQKLDKRTMVVVSSDFSRSPFNLNSENRSIFVNGVEKQIITPGTDHWPVVYTLILSGALTPGRVGAFLDSGTCCGTKSRDGTPAPDIPAYTSTQIVCSAVLKAWPELWSNRPVANGWRALKEVWPDFQESDLVSELLV